MGQNAPISKRRLWTGRAMSTLAALFLFVDGVMKLAKPASVVEATIQLGYPENVILGIGVVLLVCVLLYVIPNTSILGAILLTGYLGGAIATQVRVGNPLFSHTLFPVYIALLIWAGSSCARTGCVHSFPCGVSCRRHMPRCALRK